jgi:hypothetical protein
LIRLESTKQISKVIEPLKIEENGLSLKVLSSPSKTATPKNSLFAPQRIFKQVKKALKTACSLMVNSTARRLPNLLTSFGRIEANQIIRTI